MLRKARAARKKKIKEYNKQKHAPKKEKKEEVVNTPVFENDPVVVAEAREPAQEEPKTQEIATSKDADDSKADKPQKRQNRFRKARDARQKKIEENKKEPEDASPAAVDPPADNDKDQDKISNEKEEKEEREEPEGESEGVPSPKSEESAKSKHSNKSDDPKTPMAAVFGDKPEQPSVHDVVSDEDEAEEAEETGAVVQQTIKSEDESHISTIASPQGAILDRERFQPQKRGADVQSTGFLCGCI